MLLYFCYIIPGSHFLALYCVSHPTTFHRSTPWPLMASWPNNRCCGRRTPPPPWRPVRHACCPPPDRPIIMIMASMSPCCRRRFKRLCRGLMLPVLHVVTMATMCRYAACRPASQTATPPMITSVKSTHGSVPFKPSIWLGYL